MPDLLDEILEKLPPSTLKILSDNNGDVAQHGSQLSKSLKEVQKIKINQINKELKKQIYEISSNTAECKDLLTKIGDDLEALKSTNVNTEQTNIEVYMSKINELESQLKNLTKDYNNVDLTDLFNDVESLSKEAEEYKKKIEEVKGKYKKFNGFPPDMDEAREAINNVKKQIMHNESMVADIYKWS